jgi:hypothetical protein
VTRKKIPLPFSTGHTYRLTTMLNLFLDLFEILDIKPGWSSSLPAKRSRITTIPARWMDYILINHKRDQKNPYTNLPNNVITTNQIIERINAGLTLHFLLLRPNLHTKLTGRERVL